MQDGEGVVWVRYSPVTPLKARYNLRDAAIVDRIDALLHSLTDDIIRNSWSMRVTTVSLWEIVKADGGVILYTRELCFLTHFSMRFAIGVT